MDKLQFSQALSEIWRVIGRSNKYIDETAPWVLAKKSENLPRLATVLFNLAEVIRVISILIQPFMTQTPRLIQQALGIEDPEQTSWAATRSFGLYQAPNGVRKGDPIFPRIDLAKEIASLDDILSDQTKSANQTATSPKSGQSAESAQTVATSASGTAETSPVIASASAPVNAPEGVALIEFADFEKLQLLTGTILACEKVAGSDKLLMSQIDVGFAVRTVVSGIAASYQPEQLIGKQVILVANLKPRKIRGVVSHGMVLCATTTDGYRVLTVDAPVPAGSEVG
jgi:methionyl-tRNA synthetase